MKYPSVRFLGLSCYLTIVAGAFFFLLIPGLSSEVIAYYAATEPYFVAPVPLMADSTLEVRSDKFGKGFFGASRNGNRTHQGVDFTAAINDPIRAAKSGRVIRATEEPGYGKHVYIAHPDGRTTRYAHMSAICVQKGDWVLEGQDIGLCGKTGNAGNPKMIPHLHFEIRDSKNKSINPTLVGVFDPSLRVKT